MRSLAVGFLGTAMALAVSGCGSSNSANQGDVQAYAALARQIGSTASAYGSAASATVDPAGCQSVHQAYDGQVHPMVDSMRASSGSMDQQMGMMGRPGQADMTCGAEGMGAELAHHDAVACTSTAMSANHAEAARHVTAMTAWASHQAARASEVEAMMGMGGGMIDPSGSISTCHANQDGSFTLGP